MACAFCIQFAYSTSKTPPQTDPRPISLICFSCFGHSSAFIKTSVVWLGFHILLTVMTPPCVSSHIQCQHKLICLEHLWNWGFFAILRDPSLSPRIRVGLFLSSNPSSEYKIYSQQASCTASESVTYSASVDDCACRLCLLELQEMAPSPAI